MRRLYATRWLHVKHENELGWFNGLMLNKAPLGKMPVVDQYYQYAGSIPATRIRNYI